MSRSGFDAQLLSSDYISRESGLEWTGTSL